MTSMQLFKGLNGIDSELLGIAEQHNGISKKVRNNEKSPHLPVKRIWLIAALISLLLLLIGCATYFYRLENLILMDFRPNVVDVPTASSIPPRETDVSNETKATITSPIVADTVLSVHGYEGSPAYLALSEWLVFSNDYVMTHPDCKFNNSYQRPDEYRIYPCYTQEMVAKVDELCEKYSLHPLGNSIFLRDYADVKAQGLVDVLSPKAPIRCFAGDYFSDGSVIATGELDIDEYNKIVQFQVYCIQKDAFFTVDLGINNLPSYVQWSKQNHDGTVVLFALNEQNGLIFTETDNSFISIIINEVPKDGIIFTGLIPDKEFLECICSSFSFNQ